MSRWQLRAVLLYSHDSRRRDLFFDLNAVNIVVGRSGSGKIGTVRNYRLLPWVWRVSLARYCA